MVFCLEGGRPSRASGVYFEVAGLNAACRFGCPRFPRLAP